MAVDLVGAGEGDLVLVALGSAARELRVHPRRPDRRRRGRDRRRVTELRAFVEIDAMQPQWAAYVAQTCQGDPPWAGMAQLYVEVAPANEVFSLVNAAVKNADVRCGLQVVERQYGTLELHGRDPFAVREAGSAILERIGVAASAAPRARR